MGFRATLPNGVLIAVDVSDSFIATGPYGATSIIRILSEDLHTGRIQVRDEETSISGGFTCSYPWVSISDAIVNINKGYWEELSIASRINGPPPNAVSTPAGLMYSCGTNSPVSTLVPELPKLAAEEIYCTSTYNPSKEYDDKHGDW